MNDERSNGNAPGAGSKIEAGELFQLQKQKCESYNPVHGPAVLATNLRTPENIGGLFRLADAAACEEVILLQSDGVKAEYQNIIRRVARGTDKVISTRHWDLDTFRQQRDRLPALVAVELTTNATDLFNTTLPEACCFVIGSERRGVDEEVLQSCQQAVKIPMFGQNGSMNVTHALAICLYEWHRQHTDY